MLCFRHNRTRRYLSLESICRIDTKVGICRIHCRDDKILHTTDSFASLLEQADPYLVRIHRNMCINIERVKRYAGSEVEVAIGSSVRILPVSRFYRQELRRRLSAMA